MSRSYRVVVADDETLIRESLRDAIDAEPHLHVVASCPDGVAALEAILNEKPDIAFLDVQMPGLTGIEVVETLPPDMRPAIVFVTAHDEYAIRAFEMNAVDYLLKPFHTARLRTTLDRLAASLSNAQPTAPGDIDGAVRALHPRPPFAERLLPLAAGHIHVVSVADIAWLESADNYVRVHAGSRSGLLRQTLSSLEQRLDPAMFARAHRSAVVNLRHVVQLRPRTNGDYQAVLTDGTLVTVSRTHSTELLQRLR